MSIFEAGMLICFGVAWPVSIYKSLKSRENSGKSVIFLFIVLLGYISGILNKLLNNMDAVIYLYILNSLMVAVDIGLFFRNNTLKKARRLQA